MTVFMMKSLLPRLLFIQRKHMVLATEHYPLLSLVQVGSEYYFLHSSSFALHTAHDGACLGVPVEKRVSSDVHLCKTMFAGVVAKK
jgi:hypothetical protein